MFTTKVFFKNLAGVKDFVNSVSLFPKLEVYLVSDIYTMDAHSLIGILSLDITSPVALEIREDNVPSELVEAISPYFCKKETQPA